MVKIGIYGLIRFFYGIYGFPHAWSSTIIALGGLTAFVGVICALVQIDAKRLIASYHTVSQLGYMIMGFGTRTSPGLTACLAHLANHAFFKPLLFFVIGAVIYKTGTKDMSKLGGLRKLMPITFVCGLIASMAIAGIPPFNGFFSKGMTTQAVFEVFPLMSSIAIIVGVMTLLSFTKLLYMIFWKQSSQTNKGTLTNEQVPMSMKAPMIALATCCIVFGLFAHQHVEKIILPILNALNLEKTMYLPSIFMPSHLTMLSYAGAVFAVVVWLKRQRIIAIMNHKPFFTLWYCVKEELGIDAAYSWFAKSVVSVFKRGRLIMSGYLRDYVAYLVTLLLVLFLYMILSGGFQWSF